MSPRSLLITSTLIIVLLLIWQLRWVLIVFFGAIVISVALDVLIRNLQKRIKLPRNLALLLVLSLLMTSGLFIFQLLVPELITQIKELGNLLPILAAKVKSILANHPRLIILQETIPDQFSWQGIQPIGTHLIGFAGGAANSFVQILLISLLAILLVLDPKSHRRIVISLTPKPYRSNVNELLDECRVALGAWLTGMTISASTVFVVTWASLAILKIPMALLSALVCGLLTFVPTIGPSTATILPVSIALIISPTVMMEVLFIRIILQNFEAFLLTPILLKQTVSLLPTIALLAQLSLGALLGLPGVLVALPLAVVLQVCTKRILVSNIMDSWS